ncbi:MAG: hypothetical protein JWL71_4273, partial [Acidobacteria bacterium]|nr:hypothetical protein [Acidobacteriota bacterium]
MNRIAMCTGALALALIVVSASPATATPIGRFSFDLDEVFGPFFSVENTSDSPLSLVPPGAPFRDVVIHLFSGGLGGTELQAIPLNPFDPTDTDVFVGQSRDSLFSDLTAILFDAATLSFGFD